MQNKVYKLFAFPYSHEAVEEAIKHRFNRINGHYVLVYEEADKFNTDNIVYHIINEDETEYLSDDEKVWVLECNIQIITEESLAKQDDILSSFGEKLDLLERELIKEAEEIQHGEQHDGEQ